MSTPLPGQAVGRRCTEQGFLEFHHVAPHAAGGEPTAENIQLRCRAHNGYEAELYFGPRNTAVVREARPSYVHPPKRPRLRSRLTSSGQLGPDRVLCVKFELTPYRGLPEVEETGYTA